jgi:hypothetical protein
MESYMQRRLTIETDKLLAISGLAREVGRQTKFNYKAGIWLEDFRRGLVWSYGPNLHAFRSETYIAPTWSLASMNMCARSVWHGRPRYRHTFLEVDTHPVKAKLLNCDVVLKGENIYGELMSGSITLNSMWLPLSNWSSASTIVINEWQRSESDAQLVSTAPRGRYLNCYVDEFKAYPKLFHSWWKGEMDSEFFQLASLFLIMSLKPRYRDDIHISYLLILVPTGTEGQFRRVGIADTTWEEIRKVGSTEMLLLFER